jgi:hypothetical protein
VSAGELKKKIIHAVYSLVFLRFRNAEGVWPVFFFTAAMNVLRELKPAFLQMASSVYWSAPGSFNCLVSEYSF